MNHQKLFSKIFVGWKILSTQLHWCNKTRNFFWKDSYTKMHSVEITEIVKIFLFSTLWNINILDPLLRREVLREPSNIECRMNSNYFCQSISKIWCTVWKLQKFTLTHFWQKIRESNVFGKEITNELISRKKIWWEEISCFSTLCFPN